MGCNCGNKNRQARTQQHIAKVKAQRKASTPNGLTAKQYLNQLTKNKK